MVVSYPVIVTPYSCHVFAGIGKSWREEINTHSLRILLYGETSFTIQECNIKDLNLFLGQHEIIVLVIQDYLKSLSELIMLI